MAWFVTAVHSVVYREGSHKSFRLSGAGTMPEVENLAFFGPEGSETVEAIVKDIEQGEELTARLTLIPHAPQIDELLNAATPPAWDGRVGSEVADTTVAPAAPVITRIDSGIDAADAGATTYPDVMVYLRPGNAVTPVGSYEIDHRKLGTTTWTTVAVDASVGAGSLAGYPKGDTIEVRARALGQTVPPLTSAYSAILTEVVGSNDPARLPAPSGPKAELIGSVVHYSHLNSNPPETYSSLVYRRKESETAAQDVVISPIIYSGPNTLPAFDDTPGVGRWIYSGTVNDKSGFRESLKASAAVIAIKGPERIRNGGMDTDTIWTKGTGFTIGSGVASKASGATAGLDQVLDGVALDPGTWELTWTLGGTVAGTWATRIMGGATQLSTSTRTAAGTYVDTFVVTRTDQTTVRIAATSTASTGTVDNVSLKRVA